MTENEAIESALEKVKAQKVDFGFMERFNVDENWEVMNALEKQIPKKPTGNDECICPSCNTHNDVVRKRRNTVPYDIVYCWHCGQAMKISRLE